MAVVNTKSSALTSMDASPPVKVPSYLDHGKLRASDGIVAVANGDSIGSTYRFARVHSSWRPRSITLYCDALTAGAVDIGLYDINSNGGAVINNGTSAVNLFAAAQSIATAIKNGSNVKFANLSLANAEMPYWQLAGYTTDPGRHFDIVATVTTGPTAGGNMVLDVTSVET